MKVVEYWHGTIKNYRYNGDVSECRGRVSLARWRDDGGDEATDAGLRLSTATI